MPASDALAIKPSPVQIKTLGMKAMAIAELISDQDANFWLHQARPLLAALIVREVIERNFKADLGNVPLLLMSPFVVDDPNPDGLWNALHEISAYGDDYLAPQMQQYLVGTRVNETIIATAAVAASLLLEPAVAAVLLKCLHHLI